MSKVLIIGGHGKVALRPARLLVERDDEVTSVSRDDVAAVAAAVLADGTTAGSVIGFRTGDTPIAQALHG